MFKVTLSEPQSKDRHQDFLTQFTIITLPKNLRKKPTATAAAAKKVTYLKVIFRP